MSDEAIKSGISAAFGTAVTFVSFVVFVLSGDPLVGLFVLAGLVWAIIAQWLLHIELTKLSEDIDEAVSNFRMLLSRTELLQARVEQIADALSRDEALVHLGIVDGLRSAAATLASSPAPSFVLTNLAANFPKLNNVAGFTEAQRTAREMEQRIDTDLRSVYSKVAAYNMAVKSPPTSFFAGIMNFAPRSDLNYGR
ncbi:LemA family protein [Devosia sp. XJ19-1]|uniref:LemA family protein n=1 Tax=Devosia ureilytica TaxID=2952754 RepID=A0A9Q4FS81_9HYPH|nr:LemA family protein [Devosia ureilytica]MCP8883032.1 LemA family protein [Devosia ureilytica]MCP8886600.1 LemA family protein [Devosia ureilytica]